MLHFYYMSTRVERIAKNSLENPNSRLFTLSNDVLAFATIASVLALILETNRMLNRKSGDRVTREPITVSR